MSDDGEKHFDATPARLRRAQESGDLARAGEASASVAFLSAGVALCALAPLALAAARNLIITHRGYDVLALVALVPGCAAGAGAIAAGLMQTGGVRFTAPSFKLERLSPVAGLKRMLSRDTLAHGVRAAIAVALCGCAAFVAGRGAVDAASAWSAAVRVAAVIGIIGCAFGAMEFVAARRSWLKRLRMSHDEYRRDLKEQDGDPQVRGRRRALHRSLSRGDIRRVKDAAFVICNPTHVAIALAYRPPDEPVPRVLVSAADDLAAEVRALATEAGIPLVENVALARALYAEAEVDAPIPHAHYVAVAEIVVALSRSGAL